jgi:hypothetical protein
MKDIEYETGDATDDEGEDMIGEIFPKRVQGLYSGSW